MSRTRNKQLAALGALAIAGAALWVIAYGGIEENLVYFWNPKELLEKGEVAHGATVRLGGVVRDGSVDWNPDTLDLQFDAGIAPASGPAVPVHAEGAPPQMFREGIGVVVEGTYDGEIFHAERVLVKHSNEYRAPKEGDKPQDAYRTLVEEMD